MQFLLDLLGIKKEAKVSAPAVSVKKAVATKKKPASTKAKKVTKKKK